MSDKISSTAASQARSVQRQKVQMQQAKLQRRVMQQVSSKTSMIQWGELGGFNSVAIRRKFKPLEDIKSKKAQTEKKEESRSIKEQAKIEETANQFQRKNPELEKRALLTLAYTIKDDDSVEEILRKVLEAFPDYTLADEAFDFLLQTSQADRARKLQQAREELWRKHKREVVAGKNIQLQAQQYSKEGLGSPTSLRDMYRDITGNPRIPQKLFEELSQKYEFHQLKTVISFLLHSLGSDLKSKGPSISSAELHRLLDDTRTLQAILGVYNFFKDRTAFIHSQFYHFHIEPPKNITFESLAKQFMTLLAERYISPDKILKVSRFFGISQEAASQIVVYTQMRDAIREVAPKLYKTQKQREEILLALMEVLEELEEQLEEGEDEEEDS